MARFDSISWGLSWVSKSQEQLIPQSQRVERGQSQDPTRSVPRSGLSRPYCPRQYLPFQQQQALQAPQAGRVRKQMPLFTVMLNIRGASDFLLIKETLGMASLFGGAEGPVLKLFA